MTRTDSLIQAAAVAAHTLLAAGALAAEPLTVVDKLDLAASPQQVWQTVGQFAGLASWHPWIVASERRGEAGRRGEQRLLTTGEGVQVVEEALVQDPTRMVLTYRMVEAPTMPLLDFVSTLRVFRNGGGASLVWASSFRAKDGSAPADVAAAVQAFHDVGLQHLGQRFE